MPVTQSGAYKAEGQGGIASLNDETDYMKILFIEDDLSVRLAVSSNLKRAGYEVTGAENGIEGIRLLAKEPFDLVITDLMMPFLSGLEVLKQVKRLSPDTGVIIITGFAEIKTSVAAMKDGAWDYLVKPFDPEELLITIERFAKQRKLEDENVRLKGELKGIHSFEAIIAKSSAMQAVFELIDAAAKTDISVIIKGESGTGKDLAASAIHNRSARKDKAFIRINCAAIPEALLESELFGYEKGAFTGAISQVKGKFELADGGTFFFDEIGDMPIAFQAKLLRVIETHIFERLGGHKTLTVDIRNIYATNKNLKDEVKAGRFREDLYYRINVLPISIPPLRARKEDIPELAVHFAGLFSNKIWGKDITVTPEVMKLLLNYDYPGNVRELKHAIEMAVTISKGASLEPACLPETIKGSVFKAVAAPQASNLSLQERLLAFERETIAGVLEETGNKNAAAKKLGISRETLWRKLKALTL